MRRGVPLFGLLVLALSGCAGLGPQPAEDQEAAAKAYRERAGELSRLEQWRLTGRVSVKGPEESGQVRVHWVWGEHGGRMQVRNPFGQTVLQVRNGSHGLRVRDSRGAVYRDWRARAVLQRRLGWRVPFAPMARWALGLAEEGRIPSGLDKRGRPLDMKSGAWRVTYGEYERVEGIWLPVDLRVRRDGVELHLRVDHWKLKRGSRSPDQGRRA